ncbi:calsyntenin-2 [Tachysurus ichikawai]
MKLIKPVVFTVSGEICAFKIHGRDTPFKAVVLNKTSGEGVLKASGPIDCEQQKEFTFIIQAYDCGADDSGTHSWKKSHKAVVHIQVEDVNEFSPFFHEPVYQATVTEGKIYDSIVQVEAWDQDCSAQYSQICNYEIITQNTPFAIDRNGNIRNTEHLSYDKQQYYEIMVSAYDCGQKRAKESVLVQIHIKPMCKPGWQGARLSHWLVDCVSCIVIHCEELRWKHGDWGDEPMICDKEWHYYVINVEFPAVTLFVDGVTYDPYLVTDDWPIHPSQIDVQLTVGACWQGGEVTTPRFTQYFRGSLSGLTIRPGKIETQKVISCLQACKEGLDINSMESLGKGIKFHFNPAQSVLVMESDDLENVNTAMAKVSYINSRQFPTPGLRTLHVSTTIQCFGEDSCISIPDIKTAVKVMVPSKPQIIITGTARVIIPAAELRATLGVALFKEIHIISTVTRSDATFSLGHRPGILEVMHNLDYCDVLVIGEELNPEHESLEIHQSSLLGKHLDATNSTSGISIYGVDSMANYELAIRQVRYRNWQPASLSERRFRLSCSELNGRYTSNNFNLEVRIVHSVETVEHVNQMAVQSQYMRPIHHPLVFHTNSKYMSDTSAIATVMIVMCITALVVIMVLGIYRFHSVYLEGLKEKEDEWKDPEIVWDDTTFTITVNPMETIDSSQNAVDIEEECPEKDDEYVEEKDDDELARNLSSADFHDSEEEEEEEEYTKVERGRVKGKLVWDESSLPY